MARVLYIPANDVISADASSDQCIYETAFGFTTYSAVIRIVSGIGAAEDVAVSESHLPSAAKDVRGMPLPNQIISDCEQPPDPACTEAVVTALFGTPEYYVQATITDQRPGMSTTLDSRVIALGRAVARALHIT